MNQFLNKIGDIIVAASDFVCGYPLFILLVGGGLFFLIYSRFIPFRGFKYAIDSLKHSEMGNQGQISSFEALATTIAATVGMGNIAGVAIALSIGGPGAIFWMWVSAILGMSTKFFEGTLSVLYKGKDSNGELQGGTMYMITEGLGKKFKPLAIFFALSGLIGTACFMQSNQLTEAYLTVFPVDGNQHIVKLLSGTIICILVSIVVLGGIKRIAKVASKLTPLMVVLYFLLVFYIICTHLESIPGVFASIFKGAFTIKAGVGGGIGGLIAIALTGIRRAALVNEAGVGTASIMHGASKNKEPIREGLVAMLGPSIDSGLVCTLTAIAILIQSDLIPQGGMNSVEGLRVAITTFDASMPGVGKYLLLIIVTIFAFSTMFSYSFYGQKCTGFIFGAKYEKYYVYYFLATLILAAVVPLKAIVSLVDLSYGLMAFPTMITMFILAPKAKALMNEFFNANKKK